MPLNFSSDMFLVLCTTVECILTLHLNKEPELSTLWTHNKYLTGIALLITIPGACWATILRGHKRVGCDGMTFSSLHFRPYIDFSIFVISTQILLASHFPFFITGMHKWNTKGIFKHPSDREME